MTNSTHQSDRPITLCPHCQSPNVWAVVRTALVVYLGCPGCAWVWRIPERRAHFRRDDETWVQATTRS